MSFLDIKHFLYGENMSFLIEPILSLAVLITVIVIIYFENNSLEKTNYIYKSKKIPKVFDGFKIIQISDLHDKTFGRDNSRLIRLIDDEKPDIIVVTGDIYYYYNEKIENSLKFLENISKKHRIYFVTGNHEYKDKDWENHKRIIENYGVKIIDNMVDNIRNHDEEIYIYGLKDPAFYHKSVRYTIFEEELKKMKESMDEKKFGILLSHRPDKIDIYSRNKVDLVFTGHAHGGQIRFFDNGILSPAEGFFPKYTSGMHVKENTTVVISRGLGRTIFTFRLFNRPEVVITSLKID
ncbi:Ser/Thr phosphatase family protein [[Eubacterium] yurii subsp. margaretiae ATCC 43715]|nr:Ser/Thr phosphatase family protein [[Eubacterium] yurii subsp. margaretiae ATCC 43715]